ncbi:hypothetical protein NHQ30_002329 [Ciborinia camelliae]|nr:hypothetical protein NHQ30_002329 [Ciborinia camelliae]
MDVFIEREIGAKILTSMGWTKATLEALFQHQFNTPSYKGKRAFNGFPQCDRCKHLNVTIGMFRLKIDLEFRRQLREIRTGRSQIPVYSHITDAKGSSSLSLTVDDDSLHQTTKCQDGISIHDALENDSEDLPSFPPYISQEEKKRIEELRLAEEEAKCPTYTMPAYPHHYFLALSFAMDGLSSASSVFAAVSIAIQLAETIHKLVDFWKAVEDAPDNVASIFRELGLLSKILTQSYELAQRHSFSGIFDEALKDCNSKISKLSSKIENTRNNLESSKLRKRKWAAWKIVLQKAEIDSLQKSISDAKSTIQLVQLNGLL